MSKVGISELAIRDAHQSLHATRMTTADMLPACPMLDKIGYKFIEGWGGATYDSCIRFLNEDPWDRLRKLHSAMPNSKIMMLLRGQNLLGYRHYADDVVDKFVETAAKNGIDVFRIFDACNDPRNLERATKAAKKTGKHVQMAISYAVTPYHTVEKYAELAKTYAEFGADSICIKDMSGLLKPYDAFELVTAIKKAVDLPIEIHSHATTGLSVATELKAVEAGADILDTAISSMSMGTSHSPTETIVEMLKGSKYDTGLDTKALLEIAAYFREVRTHYASLESKFLGADTRILLSQVPGGMLSNLESQLKQQGAADKMDDVLKELPVVQKDVGYVPLVTPTSQIVGTQAVFNVLFGRYERMTGEFRDLLVGKYGKLPAEPNADLVKKALEQNKMENAVTCRPADLLEPEWDKMVKEAKENGGDGSDEDTLTYAMFPKVAPKFFKERANGPVDAKEAFGIKEAPKSSAGGNGGSYTVTVNGTAYNVTSGPAGDSMSVNVNGTAYNVTFGAAGSAPAAAPAASAAPAVTGGEDVNAPVAGTLLRYAVDNGASVSKGQTVIVLESMKMELEVKAPCNGTITFTAQTGSQVSNGQKLAVIGGTAAAPAAPAPVPAASAAPKAAPAAPAAASGGKPVNAPVAGTLLRYEVSEGASVSADTTIIVVESMKMELEIKAGSAGKVHFIAATGSQITSGQAIAEIQ
ncbi:sodium-extruding oxaloacetate decarboxylase subunit alpha [Treponema porcinum]|uniref:sodium-extruding oxaloacetate decarboxylase subunit alpha n=1 Tax=Treponema porcinum TaxID=261392 RepID=UPI002354FBD2|nr:sodium-extruding oxaloacetate decarboxylase subunit alpha [Treponema porcinum]MCI6322403.1 sodium-extruding oxaloacetate decarboxylase subunit alpha [Treponema porcinum]MCI7079942.1 sodium-extruding oxaloacetate decarboxylase subunit alpha [Treponema porcinum]MDD6899584.1 sodium-extruding oxaloacetate decarboxylase subunit alpha [Treponema porcinum]